MQIIEIIGFVAGLLTMIAFLPQVIKTFREKRTKDIDLRFCVLNAVAALLWTAYGVLIWRLPLIIPNSIASIIGLSLLALKLKYK